MGHVLWHDGILNDISEGRMLGKGTSRQVNIMPKYPYLKKLQNFVFWWFYVRLGLVYNI